MRATAEDMARTLSPAEGFTAEVLRDPLRMRWEVCSSKGEDRRQAWFNEEELHSPDEDTRKRMLWVLGHIERDVPMVKLEAAPEVVEAELEAESGWSW